MAAYNLPETDLIILQSSQKSGGIDVATIEQMNLQLKTGIIEELYRKNEEMLKNKDANIKLLENEIIRYRSKEFPIKDLAQEVKAINNNAQQLSVASIVLSDIDSFHLDTLLFAYVQFKVKPKTKEKSQMEAWLKARLKADQIKLVTQY